MCKIHPHGLRIIIYNGKSNEFFGCNNISYNVKSHLILKVYFK